MQAWGQSFLVTLDMRLVLGLDTSEVGSFFSINQWLRYWWDSHPAFAWTVRDPSHGLYGTLWHGLYGIVAWTVRDRGMYGAVLAHRE